MATCALITSSRSVRLAEVSLKQTSECFSVSSLILSHFMHSVNHFALQELELVLLELWKFSRKMQEYEHKMLKN